MLDNKQSSQWALLLGALGIVYGDIGTSPLYALRECFHHAHGLALSPANVLGVLSLILWSLVLVVSIKYILFIMRADNKGEGGILALIALIAPHRLRRSTDRVRYVIPIGIFGAALLFGDGMLTPAVTVLSAIEGLKIATPFFDPYVVPITMAILVVVFAGQRFGTAKIGAVFGPIMVIWFVTLAVFGVIWVLKEPTVMLAANPIYAVDFLHEHGWLAFFVLGSVFLVVTGGEALYADMGHFGRRPIMNAWFCLVLPSLVIQYFGQGALLLQRPEAIENPFFLMAPEWMLIPMVLIATAASVIASQALISGVFSLTRQAIQLGYAPRLSIIHTSREEIGQIYVPLINWILMICTLWLVGHFKTSTNLAGAYGIAVTGTMVITTLLAYFVARRNWDWSRAKALGVVSVFLFIDLAFLGANIPKIPDGGWFPLVIGGIVFFVMSTWQRGRAIVAERLRRTAHPISDFIATVARTVPVRVPGVAVFMASDAQNCPPALLHNLKHNKMLHERIVILTVTTIDVPYVRSRDRVNLEALGPNFYRITASYGFMQTPNIFEMLEAAKKKGFGYRFEEITFFLGRETILPSHHPGMVLWREHVFSFMLRNAQRATAFFQIPPDQVIEVGMQVEI
jgi:KUP system potassium uptake protein